MKYLLNLAELPVYPRRVLGARNRLLRALHQNALDGSLFGSGNPELVFCLYRDLASHVGAPERLVRR
jgi:hypothetical protein